MTRGVKVGVPSVFLVLFLVPGFQRAAHGMASDPWSLPESGTERGDPGEGWRGGAAGARAALSLDPEALDLR